MENKNVLITLISVILLVSITFALFTYKENSKINSFEECVNAGNPIMESYPRQCKADGKTFVENMDNELVEYFSQKMFDTAVEKSGGLIPIEGFTPEMYLGLFEELEKSDFNEVKAINGIYEYKSGELYFIIDSEDLITSADGTVNLDGMNDLLRNLEKRFNVTVTSKEDVDYLIELID